MRIEDEPLHKVIADMHDIITSMQRCYSEGILTDYDVESVYNHIYNLVETAYNSDEIKEGVDDVLRGKVIYTHADELLDKGREEVFEALRLYNKGMNSVDLLVKNGVDEKTATELIESLEGNDNE